MFDRVWRTPGMGLSSEAIVRPQARSASWPAVGGRRVAMEPFSVKSSGMVSPNPLSIRQVSSTARRSSWTWSVSPTSRPVSVVVMICSCCPCSRFGSARQLLQADADTDLGPVLDDLVVLDDVHRGSGQRRRPARGRHTEELGLLGGRQRPAGGDLVALGDLVE